MYHLMAIDRYRFVAKGTTSCDVFVMIMTDLYPMHCLHEVILRARDWLQDKIGVRV